MKKFTEFGLPTELLQAVETLGYHNATAIQAASLPIMLQGRDVLAQARTGSGKTAAFGLALLAKLDSQSIRLQSLVLCPTRELADQVSKEIRALARFIPNTKVLSLCGGIPIRPQLASLTHEPHIVVGTPGRIEDLLNRNALDISALDCVILDEADRMLDMGFIDALRSILRRAPTQRHTWMFSATYPADIQAISEEFQQTPADIRVAGQHSPEVIAEKFYRVEAAYKDGALSTLLRVHDPESCLVFCNTKKDAHTVARALSADGFSARELHGGLDQRDRDETLVQFANGSCQVLVATDVAARGLDIKSLPMVIAYELPHDPAVHVHRIGRTGRAGETGLALTLVAERELPRVAGIEEREGTALTWDELPEVPRGVHPRPPRMQTLVIDAGRQDKLRPGDILGALTGAGGLAGTDVGKIDVFATRAYAAISRAQFNSTVKKLRDAKIKGRKFRVRTL